MSEEQKPEELVTRLEIVPGSVKPAPEAKPEPVPEAKPAALQYDTKPVIKLPSKELAVSNEEIKVAVDRNYLTYQEHLLAGLPVCKMYQPFPYRPVGVIDSMLTVAEASQQRAEQGRMAAIGSYFNMPGTIVQVSLEALTLEGLTKQDPRVLNEKMKPMNTNYSEDFPFRRESA